MDLKYSFLAAVLLSGVFVYANLLLKSEPNKNLGAPDNQELPTSSIKPRDVSKLPAGNLNDQLSQNESEIPFAEIAPLFQPLSDQQSNQVQSEVEDAVLVGLNPARLRELKVQSEIAIFIPQLDAIKTATVRQIKTHPGGIITIEAAGSDPYEKFLALITVGKRNIFANLSTEQGSFELVGKTNTGWLMPSRNMDQHVDLSKPDYVLTTRIGEPVERVER
ncbi:MAG: hypothetical protein ABGY96_13695 [bacterium]|nr:hypothetical protein [Gammaproteobacteria bacterium]HIL94873.1 hypothetical protein [Pseudomonadales bacterium]